MSLNVKFNEIHGINLRVTHAMKCLSYADKCINAEAGRNFAKEVK